jgi:hypothetical protein
MGGKKVRNFLSPHSYQSLCL